MMGEGGVVDMSSPADAETPPECLAMAISSAGAGRERAARWDRLPSGV